MSRHNKTGRARRLEREQPGAPQTLRGKLTSLLVPLSMEKEPPRCQKLG